MASFLEWLAALLAVGAFLAAAGIVLSKNSDRSGKSGRDTHVSNNPRVRGPDEDHWIWPQ